MSTVGDVRDFSNMGSIRACCFKVTQLANDYEQVFKDDKVDEQLKTTMLGYISDRMRLEALQIVQLLSTFRSTNA